MSHYTMRLVRTVLLGVSLLLPVTVARAGEFPASMSLQGFTGIMNSPTANVQKEGTFGFWYAKQRDHAFPYQHEDNYLFSVGLFSFLEAGGRVTVGLSPSANNDLSVQFKLTTAPFTPKDYPWLPSLAFGMQDIGLGDNGRFFRSTYFVGTSEIDRLRLSLGYGLGPDRMDGMFGGVELKVFDWLHLLGEYGTNDKSWGSGVSTAIGAPDLNVGVRVVTPDLFGYPVNLHSTLKSTVNNNPGTIDFTVGVQFSLGRDWHGKATSVIPSSIPAAAEPQAAAVAARQPLKAGENVITATAPAASATATGRILNSPVKAGPEEVPAGVVAEDRTRTETLRLLRDKLVADGFMNVRVGSNGTDLLVVEYENARYNQSQLDALGVVLGMVVKYVPDEFRTARLVLKTQNIRMLQVTVPTGVLGSFFRGTGTSDSLRDFVAVSYAIDASEGVDFVEEGSFASWFRSRLTLAPRLKTFVATEAAGLDYLLAFVPGLTVDLWKGAVLNTTANIPVVWSSGFDADGAPFRGFRNDPQLENLMLYQAIRPRHDFMVSLSGGMVANDVYGTINEAYWYSQDGNHRLGFLQGYGKDNSQLNRTGFYDNGIMKYSDNSVRTAYLGSYRYAYAPLDASLTVTGGSFWDNDTGIRTDLSRTFGDTSVSIFYKISRTAYDENYQVGGIQVAFPLTPRQGMKPYPVQVKGTDEWSYRLQTVTDSPNGANSVYVSIADNPPATSVIQTYYDRDRLTPEYVRNHLLRVRDAYRKYVQPE